MTNSLSKALKHQKKLSEPAKNTIYGTLGIPINGIKTVDIPSRPGYVYVKLRDNQNEVIQAFNNKVSSSYGLPVIVVRESNRYIVQDPTLPKQFPKLCPLPTGTWLSALFPSWRWRRHNVGI
jgi:hypothetical protein